MPCSQSKVINARILVSENDSSGQIKAISIIMNKSSILTCNIFWIQIATGRRIDPLHLQGVEAKVDSGNLVLSPIPGKEGNLCPLSLAMVDVVLHQG